MTEISIKTQMKVRYAETDQMGVVHHGNYAQYFEIARLEWLTALGFSYKKMEEQGVMLPVVSLSTQFKKPAYFDDELTITTTIKQLPNVRIEFCYKIENQNKELLTTGETVLVFMNSATRKPIKCPENLRNAIEAHLNTTLTP